jgi:predicted GIY-YIG superfamily endonuclease
MVFVYILQSSQQPHRRYTGVTANLPKRISEHNSDLNEGWTRTGRPWQLVWYAGFVRSLQAYRFERYWKHGSGKAFAQKRLL